jgi:hypothetical protein
MTHETPTPQTPASPHITGELRYFTDGMDEVFDQAGTRFSMQALQERLLHNPVDYDTGSIMVVTRGDDGEGTRQFAFDTHHMIDTTQPWLVADLDRFSKYHAAPAKHNITVGDQWESPFGLTGEVVSVTAPRNSHAVPPEAARQPETYRSRAGLARRALDAAVNRGFVD